MLEQLHESTLPYLQYAAEHFVPLMLALFSPLSVLFLVSSRMNARVEAPAPAPRLLLQLARGIMDGRSSVPPKRRKASRAKGRPAAQNQAELPLRPATIAFLQRIRLPWLLRKADWLLHDKLKLLPDAHTGRRLNFFMLLIVCWSALTAHKWFSDNELLIAFETARNGGMTRTALWQDSFLMLLFMFLFSVPLLVLPFYFARKARELYQDMAVLFALLITSIFKLVFCWRKGCCFGIPHWWGVYNDTLDTTVFPVQLFEFAAGILCVVLCILYMLYAKSYRPGRGCSFCLLSYAVPRFFWDFLRYRGRDYRSTEANGIFGLTMAQTVCLAAVAIAIAWLFVLPLEKKLMDRLWVSAVDRLRRRAAKSPSLSKWLVWRQNAATPKLEQPDRERSLRPLKAKK